MKFSRFILIKRAMLMVALLLVANPVFAKSERWQVFSDSSLLEQALSADQKSGISRFVVVFVANWAIHSIPLEKKIFSLNTREFPGYSFLVFDVSQHQKDQLQLQHMYGVSSVPAVVVLNSNLKIVQDKRVCGDIWKNTEQFSEWLKSNVVGKVNVGCEVVQSANFYASVGIKTSQHSDSLFIEFDIPQGFYLPYDGISLRFGAIHINKGEMSSGCSLVIKNNPYFGDARVCEGKAEISIDMKKLRSAGCRGRENLILRYNKYYYSKRVLFPVGEKNIRVDCE
ncbi:hypothetical protein [Halothiobacillus sp.]|uniref:hypothetical protein n=1 Tax=Halothiobacillus sp. TaxID=1891311 RepID=UPI002AD223B7|nr:hypothetical protein [Halothiobacillus sp.]